MNLFIKKNKIKVGYLLGKTVSYISDYLENLNYIIQIQIMVENWLCKWMAKFLIADM